MFLIGVVGGYTGFARLPFDPHHVYSQLGGAVLAAIGIGWATGTGRR